MSSSSKPVRSCTTSAASTGVSCDWQTPAPVPKFRTYCDAQNSRHRQSSSPQPSLNWLRRQRWLLQQLSTGRWLVNLLPTDDGLGWQPVWSERKSAALQFATEHLARQVLSVAVERLGPDLVIQTVTFVAPPSVPSAWRPIDD